ncbi:KH domain-containing protein [Phormidesmis sp. 146-35]
MADNSSIHPDYAGLVTFLVKPFLETPESLRVDCEVVANRSRVWVRLAFDGSDKGRVFGRGGRNIQAIRSVLEGVAKAAGYSAVLDIFGSQSDRESDSERPSVGSRGETPSRSTPPRSVPKPRPKLSE